MTQLMLFDAPVPTNVPVASVPSRSAVDSRYTGQPSFAATTSRDEPQRMGNLAHLVLARYDMVHRRREAQRRAAMARVQAQSA
ncbi:hypothetical protein CA51_51920 [Rosistilla oblonga]|uniref:Uncharacterized protein n=1 Tax=Rosistilla oblonga TaxID=2527990 RepID=A0A518ITY4_9BACT|nr:hypothetical protein [Rosistilla oblonga]QDV15279.1 hypothetical protein CA51_51920 [Rosistilla oblonga]QDV56549.1 hypothetical protein Mal33_25410 [Rosistilla oblonga]